MWAQYKRTFWFMQVLICLVTCGIYLTMNHLVVAAALFFVVMQVSAVVGAMWASRLKRKLEGAW
jgi:hypothetical protein